MERCPSNVAKQFTIYLGSPIANIFSLYYLVNLFVLCISFVCNWRYFKKLRLHNLSKGTNIEKPSVWIRDRESNTNKIKRIN